MTPEPSSLFYSLAILQWIALMAALFAFMKRSRWATWMFLIAAAIGVAKASWRFLSGYSGVTYFVLGVSASVGVGVGLAYASWVRAKQNTITEQGAAGNSRQAKQFDV